MRDAAVWSPRATGHATEEAMAVEGAAASVARFRGLFLVGATLGAASALGCNSSSPATEEGDAAVSSLSCEVLDAAPACPDAPDAQPSFANDIFPMLNRDCNGTCHVAGGVAWPLTGYQDVSDWSLLIQIQVQQCEMPPVEAGALPPGDRDALLAWIACGTPNN